MTSEAINHFQFDAGGLIRDYPPKWRDHNKKIVFEIACGSGAPFEGEIVYARWAERQLPEAVTERWRFEVRPGVFDYAAPPDPATIAWHVNFADPEMLVAYGSSLLAQDELQCAEHPVLGSLRQALMASGVRARTIDGEGRPTPVTISGVQRRCMIDTLPNLSAGRPGGLYGNRFASAPEEQIRAATTALCPPTISNILAMAAPSYGSGAYSREEIAAIARTAFTGFSAARCESERMGGPHATTVIHTGFWGCGAFGGNRTLMTILQALAADLAGVDVVFWAFNEAGLKVAQEGRSVYEQERDSTSAVSVLLDRIAERKLKWGLSDGN